MRTQSFVFKDKNYFREEVVLKIKTLRNEIREYYETNDIIYTPVSELLKPRLYRIGEERYFNMCHGLLHKTFKSFDQFPSDIQKLVYEIIDFYRKVLCSDDEATLQALLKWLCQLCKGIRTQAVLYLKSEAQGIGKSTFKDFIYKYVIGEKISECPGVKPLTSQFNKCLCGKWLVVFEELPTISTAEWSIVSTNLKKLATEPTLQFEEKYEPSFTAANIFNGIIITNEDLKDATGRRIIQLPLSTVYERSNYLYEFQQRISNMEVGHALYCYLLEKINTDGFYAQRDFPISEAKAEAIAHTLKSPMKFLKSILLSKSFTGDHPHDPKKVSATRFYEMYQDFCRCSGISSKHICRQDTFSGHLRELRIQGKKNSKYYWIIDLEQLAELAKTKHWLSFYDVDEDTPVNKISDKQAVEQIQTETHLEQPKTNENEKVDCQIPSPQDEETVVLEPPKKKRIIKKIIKKAPETQIYPNDIHCHETNCSSTARYGHGKRSHCLEHKTEGMTNLLDIPSASHKKKKPVPELVKGLSVSLQNVLNSEDD